MEKEQIKKLSNKELNNSLLVDTIIKISKSLQLCNVVLDFNNSFVEDVKNVISSEEYNAIQEDIIHLIEKLGIQVDKFRSYYMEVNNGLNSEQDANNTNIQEPQDC